MHRVPVLVPRAGSARSAEAGFRLTGVCARAIAATLVGVVAGPVFAQCGSGPSCFEVHGTPGCSDFECCTAVCAADAFCCATQWDNICVQGANNLCVANTIVGPVVNPANGNKYYILDLAIWQAAQNASVALGGHLASIRSQEENDWVLSFVVGNGQLADYWIGLNDKASEGSFVWTNNEPVLYTNWSGGQPDNFGNVEDVVHVWNTAGQWNDLNPSDLRIAVAEVEVYFCGDPDAGSCFSTHSNPYCDNQLCCELVCASDPFCCNNQWDSACVSGANSICNPSQIAGPMISPATGRRHELLSSAVWPIAASKADSLGQRLVTVRSGVENEFIRRHFANSVPGVGETIIWIGLNDAASEGNFVWQSGLPVTFTNWTPGEPNNALNEDYTELYANTGTWNDRGGFATRVAVTESGFNNCGSGGSCFTTHGPGCDTESCCNIVCALDPFCCNSGWDSLCVNSANNRCAPTVVVGPIINPATKRAYYGLSAAAWSEAEKFANQLGGHLAVPNTEAENTWIFKNFVEGGSFANAVFLGIHDQLVDGQFQGLDAIGPGTIGFSNWFPTQPDNANGVEDIVEMWSNGSWNDNSITIVQKSIIEVPCLGDFDGDGVVGPADLGQLLGAWGDASSFDVNFDGEVGPQDLAIVLGSWGPCDSSNCCFANGGLGCDQPGCTSCVCAIDPFCCQTQWDGICVDGAESRACNQACQCEG